MEEMDADPNSASNPAYDALRHTKEAGLQGVIVLDTRTPEYVLRYMKQAGNQFNKIGVTRLVE